MGDRGQGGQWPAQLSASVGLVVQCGDGGYVTVGSVRVGKER